MQRWWMAVALFLTAPVKAELREQVGYEYYPVDPPPAAVADLPRRLDEASPIRDSERVRHGETRWELDWTLRKEVANNQCRVTDVVVDLKGSILLPEMRSDNPRVQKRFNRYVEALREHQRAHYILGITAANNVERQLGRLKPQPDCQTLEATALDKALEILDTYRAKEDALDQKTDYGAEQGVTLNAER